MNIQFLIDSIVRQTTVLIAQLATSGGARAPLAHVANQVFLDLATELEAHGIGRKVGADMFGLALRSYQRKIQRLSESATQRGRSLWEAVFDFLIKSGFASAQCPHGGSGSPTSLQLCNQFSSSVYCSQATSERSAFKRASM